MSLLSASPGPLTTHPMIESVRGVFIWASLCSNFLTVSITGKACLAQEGQEIILIPFEPKSKLFNIS